MKNKSIILFCISAVVLCVMGTMLLRAQAKSSRQQYEYAIIKWDGPDRIQVFYPDKFDYYRVFDKRNALPKNAHDEEFCVNLAINTLGKDGWEAIQLHATRVLLRRAINH